MLQSAQFALSFRKSMKIVTQQINAVVRVSERVREGEGGGEGEGRGGREVF